MSRLANSAALWRVVGSVVCLFILQGCESSGGGHGSSSTVVYTTGVPYPYYNPWYYDDFDYDDFDHGDNITINAPDYDVKPPAGQQPPSNRPERPSHPDRPVKPDRPLKPEHPIARPPRESLKPSTRPANRAASSRSSARSSGARSRPSIPSRSRPARSGGGRRR